MNPTRETTQSSHSSRSLTLAERADRYALYQRSVQDVAWEMHFVEQTFRALRKRAPRQLREDFCGTALAACEWVKRNRRHQAIGVDIDPAVLAWGRQHNVSRLAPRIARRLRLLQADVLTVQVPTVDIILAFNFSYWIFKTRFGQQFAKLRKGPEPPVVAESLPEARTVRKGEMDMAGGLTGHRFVCRLLPYISEAAEIFPLAHFPESVIAPIGIQHKNPVG